jgi:hypothetical protein
VDFGKLANSFISEISIAPLAGWLVRVIMSPTPFAVRGSCSSFGFEILNHNPTPGSE